MGIIRASRKETYTNIDNKLINDASLDWKDLGLLVFLLSKPDNWSINAEHLAKQRKLGVKGIYTGLKAICAAGYASKKPNPKGGWDWFISDEKSDIATATPVTMPNAENRNADNRNAENGRLVNTDVLTTTEKAVKSDTLEKNENETVIEEPIVEVVIEQPVNEKAKVEKEKPVKFVKPDLAEIIAYCLEMSFLSLSAETFYDYYESNGWTISGKAKMCDWKATVRNWARRENDFKPKPNKAVKVPTKFSPLEGCYDNSDAIESTATVVNKFYAIEA
jgi:hypothetical protein